MKIRGMALFLTFALILGLFPGLAVAKDKPAKQAQETAAKAAQKAPKSAPAKPAKKEAKAQAKVGTKSNKAGQKQAKAVRTKPVSQNPKRSTEPAETVSIIVELHAPHRGTSSANFQNEGPNCDDPERVIWHFVLNGVEGEVPAKIEADFQSAGTISRMAAKVNQHTQHFYVETPGHDVLTTAYAYVMTEEGARVKLVLSHVEFVCGEKPPPPPPPGDDETDTPGPPVNPPKPKPKPVIHVKPKGEPFLPFTGTEMWLLLGTALAFGGTGIGLRKLAKHH